MFGFKSGGPTLLELIKQGLSSTQKGYDLLAPKFDQTPFLTPSKILEPVARNLQRVYRYDDMLDLCTGTGAGIEVMLPFVRNRIVGVDWSEPMLAEARKKFDCLWSAGPDIELVREDIFNLSYKNEFDLVTCFGALGHIESHRQKSFVDMIHTALRAGGKFAFVTAEANWRAPAFWLMCGFDWIMRMRNFLIRPTFIMYYLNFLLPEVLTLFPKHQWSVEVVPLKIDGKLSAARLVISTKI